MADDEREPAPRWAELSRGADHYERGRLLLEHADALADEDYWRAVADAWGDCDRQPLTAAQWRKLWAATLAALPERVTVHRGVSRHSRSYAGMSWTLDEDVAHWFPGRLDDRGVVIAGTVLRDRILAVVAGRSEPLDLNEGAEGDDLLVLAGHSPTAFAPYSACEAVKPSYSSCPTRPLAEKA